MTQAIRPFSQIPGPRGWPIIGNLLAYKLGPYKVELYHEALKDLHRRFGPVVKQQLGRQTVVHLFDPDDVRTVYQKEGKTPYLAPLQDTTKLYRQMRDLSPGLGNINGDEWYRLRKAIQQMMLRPRAAHHYLPFVNEVATEFINKIRQKLDGKNEVPDIETEVAKWSLESSARVCFETKCGAFSGGETENTAEKMVNANRQVFLLSGQLKFSLPFYWYISTPKWRKLVQVEDFFYSHAVKLANDTLERIRDLQSNQQLKEGQYSFITYLLSRPEMSEKDVIIIALSLFADGLSTTAPAFLAHLYCLAKYPDAQEALYQEIKKTIGVNPTEPITVEQLETMQYLKACVKESLRFFPTGTEVTRIIQEDHVLGGYLVPTGTEVHLNQFVNFRSKEFISNPNTYLPARWLRSSKERGSIHPYLLNPFGIGTRMCAGRRFAEQDLYTLTCRLLQNFRLEWHYGEVNQTFRTLLYPDQPVRVAFHPRNK